MSREPGRDRRRICVPGWTACLVLLAGLFLCFSSMYAAATDGPDPLTGAGVNVPAAGKQGEEAGPIPAAATSGPPDDYGNVPEDVGGGEELRIADPIEAWNRAMYHVNDKLYFWLLKPAAKGYKYVVPEGFRGLFSTFYRNLRAPIRIVNNFLQGKPGYAGIE